MSKSLSSILRWIIALLINALKMPFKIMEGMKEEGTLDYLKERMKRPSKDDILKGDVITVMFKLGWPIMVASLFRTLYNLADTIWLGRLPGELAGYSVAASSQAWTVIFIIMSVEIGFGVAALALISQYTGSKNYEKAAEYAGQLYFIVIVLSSILATVGYFLTPYLLDILTAGAGADAPYLAKYGTQYLQITFIGMPLMFLFFAFMFILRGWGDNVTPMKIMIVTSVLNVIVDPFLILGSGHVLNFGPWSFTIPTIFGYEIPQMGVQGAAIATVSIQGIAAFYSLYLMFGGKVGLKVKLHHLKPDLRKIKKFFDVGIPASAGRLGSAAGFLFLWAIVYRLPDAGTVGAAYGAGNKVLNIMFLVIGGVCMAMATMVGQSLGADMKKRAEEVAKKGIISLAILMTVIAAGVLITRELIIGFIIPGQEEIISSGARFLFIYALSIPFFGIYQGVSHLLGGSGHTKQQMVLDLTRIWALRIVLVIIFALLLEMHDTGFWIGMSASNVVAAGIAMILYSKGWWKEKIIRDEAPTTSFIGGEKDGRD